MSKRSEADVVFNSVKFLDKLPAEGSTAALEYKKV
jgi:hypothetical protein